jgi:hypothetical protein
VRGSPSQCLMAGQSTRLYAGLVLFLSTTCSILHCRLVCALEREGFEGSFGIFGLQAGIVGIPNVPENEGKAIPRICFNYTFSYLILFILLLQVFLFDEKMFEKG